MSLKLRAVNSFLLFLIIAVNICTIGMPFFPMVLFHFQKNGSTAKHLMYIATQKGLPKEQIPQDAQSLIAPSMVLDAPINDGPTIATLHKGLWRIPETSTPDKGGNTVIAAHRYTYTNPRGVFYHLDQVHVGDPVAILWHGKEYVYKVDQTEVVPPTATYIEAPTQKPTLTLFTCTPLWLPKDRLVVIASLEYIND